MFPIKRKVSYNSVFIAPSTKPMFCGLPPICLQNTADMLVRTFFFTVTNIVTSKKYWPFLLNHPVYSQLQFGIWDSHKSVVEDSSLLRCDTVSLVGFVHDVPNDNSAQNENITIYETPTTTNPQDSGHTVLEYSTEKLPNFILICVHYKSCFTSVFCLTEILRYIR